MSDRERLDATFRDALGLPEDSDMSQLAYGVRPEWDSVGHLQLMAAIEEAFGISLSSEDVVGMIDYPAVCTILQVRYHLAC